MIKLAKTKKKPPEVTAPIFLVAVKKNCGIFCILPYGMLQKTSYQAFQRRYDGIHQSQQC